MSPQGFGLSEVVRQVEPRSGWMVHVPETQREANMNSLIWLVGAVVIVLAILSLLGLH
jgi:hypothetical protein